MIKKLIALLLVLLMVVPMIASCGDNGNDVNDPWADLDDEEENGGDDEDEDPINAEIDEYIQELAADHNLSGKTFTWIGGGNEAPDNTEEVGDLEQDALYFRQRDIEEAFDVSWVNFEPSHVEGGGHPVVDAVKQDVLAGTGAYDAGYGTVVAVCQPLFIQDCLADVTDYEVIDLDREWWTSTIRDTYHFKGSIYFLNGAIVTSNYRDTYCVMFNKEVAENYNIEDLYQLVRDDEWTFDKMIEVAEAIPTNENGAGAYRYVAPAGIATLYASGLTLVDFDEDGTPSLSPTLTPELSAFADKFSAIFGDDTQTMNAKHLTGGFASNSESFEVKYGYENADDAFVDGKGLFYFEATGTAAHLRTKDVEFGILPMPKGSDTQEDYISFAEPWGAFNVFVLKSAKDADKNDVILEAMAALGYKYIKPAYYDKILKTRATTDTDSKEMIDIVFNTKVYDIIDFIAVGGDTNHDSSLIMFLKGAITESSEGMASGYATNAKLVNRNIKSLFKKLEANK